MSNNSNSANNPAKSTHENDVNSKSKARILTHEDVNEQMKIYIFLLNKQLEDLTGLIQRMSSAQQPVFTQGQVPALILAQPVTRPTV